MRHRPALTRENSVTFTGTISPSWFNPQSISWTWEPSAGGIIASRIPVAPSISMAPLASSAASSLSVSPEGDSLWSDEGAPPDPTAPIPATNACASATLICRTAVFQSGTMRLSVSLGSVVRTASATVAVHYECRPVHYIGLTLSNFRAHSRIYGDIIDSATLDAPLLFSELYGEEHGIPLGKVSTSKRKR